MKVTSSDLFNMGIVDKIIDEPNGAAHIDPEAASSELKKEILNVYEDLKKKNAEKLINDRMIKYNKIGDWIN